MKHEVCRMCGIVLTSNPDGVCDDCIPDWTNPEVEVSNTPIETISTPLGLVSVADELKKIKVQSEIFG